MRPSKLPYFFLVLFSAATLFSCKDNKSPETKTPVAEETAATAKPFFKISLAQWSLNKPIYAGELDPMDFAEKANELGFEGIEYVSAFYADRIKNGEDSELAMQTLLDSLKAKSEEFNVRNVLIMVDGEGDLATSDEKERAQAVENHKKWVDAAQFLGCHSIRVNLNGSTDPEEWKANATEGLKSISEYAATKNINVIVENHGGLSSNAALLTEVIESVNLPNSGTLPDFGNFCIHWDEGCKDEYPRYQGVEEMMPYAKAVSAKSYDFNEKGQETTIDYGKMLQIVKDAGYTGFVGIEYEGNRLSPEEGILATKQLLIEEGSRLNQEQ